LAASHRDVRPITCLRDNKIKKPEPGGEYWIAVAAIARQRLRTQSKGGCRWLNRRHLVAPRGSVCARVMSALAPRTGQTSAGGFSHQSASPAASDATWVMCKDPHSDKVTPIYSQSQLVCAPWKLTDEKSPEK